MIHRHLTPAVLAALKDTPVVLLQGARQTGKSTLARWIAAGPHRARYLTLDDPGILASVQADPTGFLAQGDGPLVLDEVQRAPGLFLPLKALVDRHRAPGRFLLTGSANVLTAPRIADSLAGRMQALTLRPFSQGEIEGRKEGFLVAAMGGDPMRNGTAMPDVSDIHRRMLAGGYPEPRARPAAARRQAWHTAYVRTLLQRDVRDLSAVEGLASFPRLLGILATRSGLPLGASDISRDLGMPYSTLRRYLALLEATFLIHLLPAWSPNRGQQFVKAPKLILGDTGVMSSLLGASPERLPADAGLRGRLLETFVILELMKQADWMDDPPAMHHFRTHTGDEVDLVVEEASGRVTGFEIKHAATLNGADFKGLRRLQAEARRRFHRGILLYLGKDILPFGDGLSAVPLPTVWGRITA